VLDHHDLAKPPARLILGMRVDAVTYESVVAHSMDWARRGVGTYVCVGNVHMVMETVDDPAFRTIVNDAAIVTPDGMPLVWALRVLGIPGARADEGAETSVSNASNLLHLEPAFPGTHESGGIAHDRAYS
jgi:UDP-N-acetyl-D-mannosaminuronic acid transferase (WecB/TagA/CpsF family)